MKVLLINGSPHENGNTFTALNEVAKSLNDEGINTEIISIGKAAVQGCIACDMCGRNGGRCTFHDDLYYRVMRSIKDGIDGLVIGSPVYYGGPNGSLCALLDRVFYSLGRELRFKPGACVVVCRRGGATATFDRLNKYFTIMEMPVVSSQYWNLAYGHAPGQVAQDEEGMQTMHTLGRNMAWMIRRLNVSENGHP
ncbi:MAG: flavodoxin family protein [Bacteroidaceae bacterium]|jgi:multimeric flavodoxin WrbA|nr:flavodoxin family protein [Bacteroidaceae bacterium]